MTEVVAGGHWSCSSGGDVFIGVLEIIIRYLVIITRVLARNNRPCPSIYIYTLLCDRCDVSHGVTETCVFCGSMFWLLYSPHKSDFALLNISAAYLYFSLCVQNILFLYIQFILSRSYSNIKTFLD